MGAQVFLPLFGFLQTQISSRRAMLHCAEHTVLSRWDRAQPPAEKKRGINKKYVKNKTKRQLSAEAEQEQEQQAQPAGVSTHTRAELEGRRH